MEIRSIFLQHMYGLDLHESSREQNSIRTLYSKINISSACMAETLAIRNALLHATELNINHIWLHSHLIVLIRALSSKRQPIELYVRNAFEYHINLLYFISCHFSPEEN